MTKVSKTNLSNVKGTMNDLIECRTMTGTKMIPKENISFRPSVYGVIVSDGKLLLTKMRSTGKYWLPGGGVDVGETLEQAVKREVLEECGIRVHVHRPTYFGERFFYYEPLELASHAHLFLSLCTPLTFGLTCHDAHDESGGEEMMKYLKTV